MDNWTGPVLDLAVHPALGHAAQKIMELYARPGCLILAGSPGSGKTTLARILIHSLGPKHNRLLSTNDGFISRTNWIWYEEPSLLDDIRSEWDINSIIQQTKRADLLVLDDLGAGYVSSKSLGWYQSIFWRMIDHRANDPRSRTLMTTNLDPVDIRDLVGPRSWSRLKGMMGAGEEDKGMEGLVNMFDIPDYRSKDWKGKGND